MKKIMLMAAVFLVGINAFSADKSEEGVPTTPLKIYSGGISVGGLRAVSGELKDDIGKNLLKLSFANVVSIRNNVDLFLDATWLVPENNYGADFGIDFIFSESDFRPFAGMGIGGYVLDHSGEFSKDFGPAVTAHIGFTHDINENVAVRIRAPFHIIMNEYNDQTAGIDVTFLFSSKFKNIKKLNYN